MSGNDDVKKQLEGIQNQLKQMQKEIIETKMSISEAKMSISDATIKVLEGRISETKTAMEQSILTDFALYYSIVTSALIGVMGNWFVSLWFQPHTRDIISGLIISGFFLVITIAYFMIETARILRKIKK